jgi:hypothetical protein
MLYCTLVRLQYNCIFEKICKTLFFCALILKYLIFFFIFIGISGTGSNKTVTLSLHRSHNFSYIPSLSSIYFVFLIQNSCRATIRNSNSISADVIESTIENDYNNAFLFFSDKLTVLNFLTSREIRILSLYFVLKWTIICISLSWFNDRYYRDCSKIKGRVTKLKYY